MPMIPDFLRRRRTAPTPARGAVLFDEFAVDQIFRALAEMPDPDLILQQAGLARADLRRMEYDDEISAALETRRDACVGTPWRLEPAGGPAVDWLWAELAPHVDTLIRALWSCVPYGYSVVEMIYRRDTAAGRVGIGAALLKPIEWFRPTHDGRLLYRGPNAANAPLPFVGVKWLLAVRNPTYRNPYGEALLSRLYWPWYFRHNGWRFWMHFLERFGSPLILGQTLDQVGFVKAVQNLGLEAVIGVDREDQVTAVTQAAAGEFERLEHALIARINRVILGQTLTTSIGQSGSFAAAKVHNQVRDDKRASDIRIIAHAVQQLVDALWAMNRLAGAPPAFVMADDRGLEEARATRDATLADAGIVKFREQYLLRAYDFEAGEIEVPEIEVPEVEVPEVEVPEVDPPPPAGQGADPDDPDDPDDPARIASLYEFAHQARAGKRSFTPAQQAIETLADTALAGAPDPIRAARVRGAIRAARDAEDLRMRLAALVDEADPKFEDLLIRAQMAAEAIGYVAASEQRS